jgi:uncharacterized protein
MALQLNRALIDILACPKCKGALILDEAETRFTCKSCKLAFAVVDGIPNFIVDEAESLAGK